VRICLVYDCLYPVTVGGVERWYRRFAEALARSGHEVTYLTTRQWDDSDVPVFPGVRVVAVTPGRQLYARAGRRRAGPPIVFGLAVFRHLLRHGRRYDVVHTASFPYFPLLAAGTIRPLRRYALVVDWVELWSLAYWREYLGNARGRIGFDVQRLCLRLPQRAFCFSSLVEERLRAAGINGEVTRLAGLSEAPEPVLPGGSGSRVVVFAGRHIPEKRVPALVPAFLAAREQIPDLRCEIYGDGPEREEVLRLVREADAGDAIVAPGFVEESRVTAAIGHALCLVLPSKREGYGLVVAEAAAQGTPSIVVAGADNAAVELVEEGVNGAIAPSASPDDLADAIIRVERAGPALRESTADWYRQHADRFSLERSLEIVERFYGSAT